MNLAGYSSLDTMFSRVSSEIQARNATSSTILVPRGQRYKDHARTLYEANLVTYIDLGQWRLTLLGQCAVKIYEQYVNQLVSINKIGLLDSVYDLEN